MNNIVLRGSSMLCIIGILCLFGPLSGIASAPTNLSNDCEAELSEAEGLYRTGGFDRAKEMIKDCLEPGTLSRGKTLQAYRLLSLIYIAQDHPEGARRTVTQLLNIAPDYKPDSVQDPPPFTRLVEDVREEQDPANSGDLYTLLPGTERKHGLRFGFKSGLNIAQLRGDLDDILAFDLEPRHGIATGAYLSIPVASSIYLQPELLYTMKGATGEFQDISVTYIFDYLEIPVFAKYTFTLPDTPVRPVIFAGPALGIALSSKLRFEDETASEEDDVSDEIKSTDFGMIFGVGADFDIGNFIVGADIRYGFSLNTIDDLDDDFTITNSVFSIMLSFGF